MLTNTPPDERKRARESVIESRKKIAELYNEGVALSRLAKMWKVSPTFMARQLRSWHIELRGPSAAARASRAHRRRLVQRRRAEAAG